MTVDTLEDLFEHGLEDIYYAENELLDVLADLADETENGDVIEAFQKHRDETQRHIERLEEVFDEFGEQPEKEECEGIQGIVEEHESFVDRDPDQAVLDVYNLAAAEKTEHYEIAAYGNLAFIADELGMDRAADLLGQNLDEEKQALERLKQLTERYDYEPIKETSRAD